METDKATKGVLRALDDLIGCFPKDSDQAKALNGQKAAILDVVLGIKGSKVKDETAKLLYEYVGQNATARLKNALSRRQTDNALAELLERSALLDEVTKHVEG